MATYLTGSSIARCIRLAWSAVRLGPSRIATHGCLLCRKQAIKTANGRLNVPDPIFEVPGLGAHHPVTREPLRLRDFQKAGVRYAVEKKRCFIADEMGLGKTVQALAAVQSDAAYPALVVCPKSMKTCWAREASIWLPHRSVTVINAATDLELADILVINFDILARHVEELRSLQLRALIIDESHYAKTASAQRTKALRSIASCIPKTGMILALTGTPMLNCPRDLVSQLQILGRIRAFGGVKSFRERFCSPKLTRWGWDYSGCSNAEELHELLLQTCFLRRDKASVLAELPEKSSHLVSVNLAPVDMAEYAQAAGKVLSWLVEEGESVSIAQAEAKFLTLRRMVGEAKVEPAFEWVDSFLESTSRKLVVFAHHRSVVNAMAERYGGLRIAGADSSEARAAAVSKFQNDVAHRVIVLNLRAGGVGLTLTAASDVFFVEQGWTPAEHSQAEDRCHRIGQVSKVSAWYLVASGTIDDDIFKIVERKRTIIGSVVDGQTHSSSSVKDLARAWLEHATRHEENMRTGVLAFLLLHDR